MKDAIIEKTHALAEKIASEFSTKAKRSRGQTFASFAFLEFTDAFNSTYEMKFEFEGMHIEIYIYYPYSEMKVRNFVIMKDVSFCINRQYSSVIGAVKSINLFKTIHNPVFINPYDPSNGNAAFICGDIKNEQDIKALQLGADEFLMFMGAEINMRSQTNDPAEIRKRLNILKCIITRNGIIEKSGEIFCKNSFRLLFGDASENGNSGIRFGGVSKRELTCINCHKAMHQLLELNVADLKLADKAPKFASIEILFCLSCQIDSAPTYYKYDESGVCALIEQPKNKSYNEFGTLPERSVSLTTARKRKLKHQFGGKPNWLQGPYWLQCPECHEPMSFLLQMDTDPNLGIQFGDDGMLYSFICEKCRVVGNVVQGH